MGTSVDQAAALSALADILEAQARVLRGLTSGKPDTTAYVDQKTSPLGTRRHCAIVRKLVAAEKPGAAILGRRYLLTPEAINVALKAASDKAARSTDGSSISDELTREIAMAGRAG